MVVFTQKKKNSVLKASKIQIITRNSRNIFNVKHEVVKLKSRLQIFAWLFLNETEKYYLIFYMIAYNKINKNNKTLRKRSFFFENVVLKNERTEDKSY